MRVAIAAESFFPRVNGVSNSVAHVVKYLKSEGIPAEIIAPGLYPGNEFHGTPVHRVRSVNLPGVHDFDISMTTTSSIITTLEKFQPTLVHLASPFVLGSRVLQACRILDIPTVAVFQTDVAGYARHYGLSSMSFIADGIVRRIHSSATINLAPSTSAQNYLRGLGIKQPLLWGRGVDHEVFNPEHRSEALRSSWQAGNKIIVGYCGRLAPEKGIGMMKYLQADSRVKLVIIGDGPDRNNLENLLPNAIFTGRLTGHELGSAMASLDVLVAPGELETFCQVIQEGMAAGTPVIAPAIGGPLDLISHEVNGLLYPPGDAAEMVRQVDRLVSDADLRKEISGVAHDRVQSRTWSALGRELVGHYQSASRGLRLPAAA